MPSFPHASARVSAVLRQPTAPAESRQSRKPGVPGEVQLDFGAIDLKKGGSAIPYHEEDPAIRAEFTETLKKHGVENRMLPEFYTSDAGDAVGNVM